MSFFKFLKVGFAVFSVVLSAEADAKAIWKEYCLAMADHHLSGEEATGLLNRIFSVIFRIYPGLKS